MLRYTHRTITKLSNHSLTNACKDTNCNINKYEKTVCVTVTRLYIVMRTGRYDAEITFEYLSHQMVCLLRKSFITRIVKSLKPRKQCRWKSVTMSTSHVGRNVDLFGKGVKLNYPFILLYNFENKYIYCMYIIFYLYKPSYLFCYFYLFNDFMIIDRLTDWYMMSGTFVKVTL